MGNELGSVRADYGLVPKSNEGADAGHFVVVVNASAMRRCGSRHSTWLTGCVAEPRP